MFTSYKVQYILNIRKLNQFVIFLYFHITIDLVDFKILAYNFQISIKGMLKNTRLG